MRTGTRSLRTALVSLLAVTMALPLVAPTPARAAGTVSLTALDVAYTQNFDTLAVNTAIDNSVLPNGWHLTETGGGARDNEAYAAGTGSSNTGDTYSFGAAGSTERAFGGLLSGTLVPTIGANFANSTGGTVTSLAIAYTGEQWRLGATGRAPDRLDFQISFDATDLVGGTWTDVDTLDFSTPNLAGAVGLRDGNAPENRTAVSATIGDLSIPNGASFWIRWNDFNVAFSDDGLAVDDFSLTPVGEGPPPGDQAPGVTATTPANGATDVAADANIQITFTEPVDVTGEWFDIACTSGDRLATASGGPTTFTLDPAADFGEFDECTVTIVAANVSDQDTDDPPDAMAADHVFSFTAIGDACVLPYTPIYDIQGSGNSAAITGTVSTQGVVVGAFGGPTGIGGFYLQDAAGDGEPTTSDGIFVYTGSADPVEEGDVVRVTGFARERFTQTTINGTNSNNVAVTDIVDCSTEADTVPDPVEVQMPFPADAGGVPYLERFEGMLITFPQSLVISEYFDYDRFGEIVLALPLDGEDRHFTPTSVAEPGAEANARLAEYLARRITLDDGLGIQNPDFTRHPNGDAFSTTNRFRGGDLVTDATGVLGFDFSKYRIQPTEPAVYTAVNERPGAPDDVGGRLKVAAMNMLNFYITADYPTGDPLDNACGPANNQECRGHDSNQPDEFDRQRVKLLEALAGLDADVIGLNEIENSTGVDPLSDPKGIVPGLNDMFGAGTYASIDTGPIGTDAIKVGIIYRPGSVTPVGDYAILDSSVDPRFDDQKSRPALAQTFEEVATGERFTVIVNHLKSKGSSCNDVGDPDLGDGQGNCNLTRLAAAEALVDWAESDPTGSGDPDYLITGDLNSYAKEDPIDAILAGPDGVLGTSDDYVNLIEQYVGEYAYSYVFDGQNGYLDHALANLSLTLQVTGATEWHINADEPDILDYDTSFKSPTQDGIYEPNAYRSSDHDPVIIGLDLATPGRVTGSGTFDDGSFSLSAQQVPNGSLAGETSVSVDGIGSFVSTGYEWLVVETPEATYAGTGTLNGTAGYEFLVSVRDGGNPGSKDRIRVVIWDSAGAVVYDSQPGDWILEAPSTALTGGNLRVSARR